MKTHPICKIKTDVGREIMKLMPKEGLERLQFWYLLEDDEVHMVYVEPKPTRAPRKKKP